MFIIYSTQTCSYCKQAKALLQKKGLEFTEVVLNPDNIDEFNKKTNYAKTVPQVFYSEGSITKHIGGYTDLQKFADSWWPDQNESQRI